MLRQSRGRPPTDGGHENTRHLPASSSQLQTEIQQHLLALTPVTGVGLTGADFHYVTPAENDGFVLSVMNTTFGYNMQLTKRFRVCRSRSRPLSGRICTGDGVLRRLLAREDSTGNTAASDLMFLKFTTVTDAGQFHSVLKAVI